MKNPLARKPELIQSNIMRLGIFYFLCVCIVALPCQTLAAKGESRQEQLQQVETRLQKEKSKQKKLQRDKASLEKRLEQLRRDVIHVTALVQKQEQDILSLQKAQEESAQDMQMAQQDLDEHRESLAGVITALQRISRVPPEALLARPSAPIDMARSFGLLEQVVPAVSAQAQEIRNLLGQIVLLREEQNTRAQQLLVERKELDKKQARLGKMIKNRESLLAKNDSQQQKTQREIEQLARQSKDLRELMTKIRQQERAPQATPDMTAALEVKGRNLVRSLKDWFVKSGTLPVAGEVVTGYGDKMPGGGVSQGLRIKASSGAVVTMPQGGVVRFAGAFRQYKLLVIVQHDNGDHSLLGGMHELYTKTGAYVAAGEPLGKLPKLEGDSTPSSSLYYERRRNGKPIDPRRA